MELKAVSAPSSRDSVQADHNLLKSGWLPMERSFDWEFFGDLWDKDAGGILQRALKAASAIANGAGNKQLDWWARLLQIGSAEVRAEFDAFWNYITPSNGFDNKPYSEELIAEIPVPRSFNYEGMQVDHLFSLLRETIAVNLMTFLGTPGKILQYSGDLGYVFPPERFQSWERLEVISEAYAYWSDHDVWLKINQYQTSRQYTFTSKQITPLISKTTFGLALILSGYQSRIGQLQSEHQIASYPRDIQVFSDAVQDAVMTKDRLAVLVHGEPGCGKTVWTQAIAKEVLVPLGFIVFILDHAAFESFSPPPFLERVCIIVNDVDNLAQDRAVATRSNRTERVLSLMDGSLYKSVMSSACTGEGQKLVVLMTCNTTDRLDSAFLRPGRVDMIQSFSHRFVSQSH